VIFIAFKDLPLGSDSSFLAFAMSFIKANGRSDFTQRNIHASEVATSVAALALLKQSKLRPQTPPGTVLLDNASGAGTLTAQLLKGQPAADKSNVDITCIDLDLAMLDNLKDRIITNSWQNVQALHLDAHHTDLPDEHFTHVLMNFGPQLMKDPKQMLAESRRILKPGGVLGFTTWVIPGFIPSMKAVFPDFGLAATPIGREWADPNQIKKILLEKGFEEVNVEECAFQTEYQDVEGYL
jgi:ubiquinone/menaquinone biosynthesis C-methylase UbiE